MLTSKQRAQLRSLAANMDVIMQVGKNGVTEAMAATVSDALEARELIKMRREEPAIVDGDLRFWLEDHERILLYTRSCMRQTLLIVANYSGESVELALPEELGQKRWKRLLTNKKETQPALYGNRDLLPWEVEIYELVGE